MWSRTSLCMRVVNQAPARWAQSAASFAVQLDQPLYIEISHYLSLEEDNFSQ